MPSKGYKCCSKCSTTRHLAEFTRARTTSDGLSAWCKECHREAVRVSRRKNGERWNARRRNRITNRVSGLMPEDDLIYMQALILDRCYVCGERSTELDHLDARSRDGGDGWENRAGICRDCNARKQDLPLINFMLMRLIRAEAEGLRQEMAALR